ncbi:MAG: glutamate racemase [Solirubrobacterales bacterium]
MDNRPIGVFDSGLGGLTVFKALSELVPSESVVYFGDCGRVPYGTKSRETVIKYTFQNIRFLLNQDIKMIVIACNTASANSLELVKNSLDIPIVEVVQPGADKVLRETRNKRVGIIGTAATVASGAYEKAINRADPSVTVFSKACRLFVELVEEGWWDNEIALKVAQEYLMPLKSEEIDTLVLGCTHYPLLQSTIEKVMGDGVKLVNSASEVAKAVKETIEREDIARDSKVAPVYRFYTSDSVEKFEALGGRILNRPIYSASKIDIERY